MWSRGLAQGTTPGSSSLQVAACSQVVALPAKLPTRGTRQTGQIVLRSASEQVGQWAAQARIAPLQPALRLEPTAIGIQTHPDDASERRATGVIWAP